MIWSYYEVCLSFAITNYLAPAMHDNTHDDYDDDDDGDGDNNDVNNKMQQSTKPHATSTIINNTITNN